MHIPDGYLSLQTSLPLVGTVLPLWAVALKKISKTLKLRQVPLLSLCAAFSFIIMMFNIPLGPSSVHAAGGVFIAILMGPWASFVAVSIALIIQAVLFSDGGIIAIGANCFNIAFAMPFTGYLVYKLLSDGSKKIDSKRNILATFAASYIGINAAALLTAIEFGIQPLLFVNSEGIPLYGFYPLSVSIPVMMFEHLLVAGPVEGIITVGALAYLNRFNPELFSSNLDTNIDSIKGQAAECIETTKTVPFYRSFLKNYKGFAIGLLILALLSPLGLIAGGTAWGEWGPEEVEGMVGYVPAGMQKFSEYWKALIPDYTVAGLENGPVQSSFGYIISAIAGIVIIGAVIGIASKWIADSGNTGKR